MREGRFAELLRRYRQAAHLSQEELAERAGLSVQAISMLERGVRSTPRMSTVESLVKALDLDANGQAALAETARQHPATVATDGPTSPHDAATGATPADSHEASAHRFAGLLRAHRVCRRMTQHELAAAAAMSARAVRDLESGGPSSRDACRLPASPERSR